MTEPLSRLCESAESPFEGEHDLAGVAVAADLSSCATKELASRARNGCAAAFAELCVRFRPRLLRFLEKQLSQVPVDAEDVVQDTLAKAWRAIASFDPRFQFTTWIYTIARRVSTDYQRRSSSTMHCALPEELPGAESPAEAHVEQAEVAGNIWATARRVLNTDQYSALWLRYGEELPVKDVARVLRRTTVGVRVLLHRARATLQPHLKEYAQGGAPSDDRRHQSEGVL